MSAVNIEDLFRVPQRIVVTSHRGFSARYPENTLVAFEEAVRAGTDLIEFDLRGSRERIPVILHDSVIDKISNGSGSPGDYTLPELKRFDFSSGKNSQALTIPSFEEALQAIPESIGLNIQVKETDQALLLEICRLFDTYRLYPRAYLTLSTFTGAEAVKKINAAIEICVLERKYKLDTGMLKEMKSFGCRYLQPHRRDVTPELCREIRAMVFYATMYYSNTDADNRRFISYGMQGIMTDAPDMLAATLKTLGR